MSEFDGMFPNLDYDILNKSLSPTDFDKSLTNQPQSLENNLSDFKDGIEMDGMPESIDNNINVSENDIPSGGTKEWSNLSKEDRIKNVIEEASGMPLVSMIDVTLLMKTATRMSKRGMYRESAKVLRAAENFTKELLIQESIEQLQEVQDSMDKFGFDKEAINIRRFFRKALKGE